MKKENIVTRKWGDRRKGKTDWARVDALTDEDIAEAVANDPDAAPIDIDWSDAVLVIPARKKAISIRVDEDVLDFFSFTRRPTTSETGRRAFSSSKKLGGKRMRYLTHYKFEGKRVHAH